MYTKKYFTRTQHNPFNNKELRNINLSRYPQILLKRQKNKPICDILIKKYGTAVGKGGGVNVGPAQRIAQALGRSDRIETHYLDTQKIAFGGKKIFRASDSDCGLFRLRD